MSEPINGSAAHLLPVSNSEQSASFGRSSFMASNDEATKVGYANQDQSNLQTPSYYIKTLWDLPVLRVLVLPTALVQMFAQQQLLTLV